MEFSVHYIIIANKNIEPWINTPHIKYWFCIELSFCSVFFDFMALVQSPSSICLLILWLLPVFALLHALLPLYCVHILSVSHPPSAAAVSFLLFSFSFSSATFTLGSALLLCHSVFIRPWASGSCFRGCFKKLPPHKSLHMCFCCTLLPVCYRVTPNSSQIGQLWH